jgi:hypothetical protein|tara:strand:- start:138 stop:464 length:327 start_codon:yes stop_codon:yes gene_type:complete
VKYCVRSPTISPPNAVPIEKDADIIDMVWPVVFSNDKSEAKFNNVGKADPQPIPNNTAVINKDNKEYEKAKTIIANEHSKIHGIRIGSLPYRSDNLPTIKREVRTVNP